MPALVPGMVEAALLALREYGTLNFHDIIAPAIDLADGFPLDEMRSASIAYSQPFFNVWPTSKAHFLPNGRPPQPGESIPWHYHSDVTDHYFVLRGTLTIKTRDPDSEREFEIGNRHRIMPETAHLLSNREAMDCQFLLLQGVGKYDWIEAEG